MSIGHPDVRARRKLRLRRPWPAALALLLSAGAAGAETVRHPVDGHEIQRLAAHPAALSLLQKGEALALAGDMDQAYQAFHEAADQAPESGIVARRECQALTALGRRAEALLACTQALRNLGSAIDLRATVAVFMSGPDLPTSNDLAQAMRLARRARETMPQEPWGAAAECDIATKIGDSQMLERCVRELERIAPNHYETIRALAAAAPYSVNWRVCAGWLAILLLALGTLGHAAWHALASSARRSRAGAAALGILVLALGSYPTAAQAGDAGAAVLGERGAGDDGPPGADKGQLGEWPIDDKDPVISVPSDSKRDHNPLQFGYWLMDLTWKADDATKKGDHQAAIRYYQALVKAVPDRSISFTRLCEAYEAAGEWQKAMEQCTIAITRPGVTVNEYVHYFKVALAKKGPINGAEVGVLNDVIQHLREDKAGHEVADDLECQLGARMEDVNFLRECTAALVARAPKDPRTVSYRWALAMAEDDFDQAEAMLADARAIAMDPAAIEQMTRGMAALRDTHSRKLYAWLFGALGVALAGGAAALFFARRRKEPRPA